MKLTLRDLIKLRWAALFAIFLLFTATALAYWGWQNTQQANTERASAEKQWRQTEQRLRQTQSDAGEIMERSALFLQLEKSAITGTENRLEWIEQLRDLQRQLRLPGMNYEFSPQLAQEKIAGATFAYHSSHLHIQLRLRHEEELLNLLKKLQPSAQAMVLVRSCRLARSAASNESGAGLHQLSAECDIEWVSLHRIMGSNSP